MSDESGNKNTQQNGQSLGNSQPQKCATKVLEKRRPKDLDEDEKKRKVMKVFFALTIKKRFVANESKFTESKQQRVFVKKLVKKRSLYLFSP